MTTRKRRLALFLHAPLHWTTTLSFSNFARKMSDKFGTLSTEILGMALREIRAPGAR